MNIINNLFSAIITFVIAYFIGWASCTLKIKLRSAFFLFLVTIILLVVYLFIYQREKKEWQDVVGISKFKIDNPSYEIINYLNLNSVRKSKSKQINCSHGVIDIKILKKLCYSNNEYYDSIINNFKDESCIIWIVDYSISFIKKSNDNSLSLLGVRYDKGLTLYGCKDSFIRVKSIELYQENTTVQLPTYFYKWDSH